MGNKQNKVLDSKQIHKLFKKYNKKNGLTRRDCFVILDSLKKQFQFTPHSSSQKILDQICKEKKDKNFIDFEVKKMKKEKLKN